VIELRQYINELQDENERRIKELEGLVLEAYDDPHSRLTISLIDRMGAALAGGKEER
jgi:hypothetical protein